jgi:hypothetical protein
MIRHGWLQFAVLGSLALIWIIRGKKAKRAQLRPKTPQNPKQPSSAEKSS